MAILISKNLPFVFQDSVIDPRGCYVFVKCTIDNSPYTLASLYAPNMDQVSFIADTLSLLNEFKVGELLIGGDLNYVSDGFGTDLSCHPLLEISLVKPDTLGTGLGCLTF